MIQSSPMQIILLIILVILALLILLLLIFKQSSGNIPHINNELQRVREEIEKSSGFANESRKEVHSRIDRVHDQLTKGMMHSHTSMQKQGSKISDIIESITKELSEVKQTSKQVLDYSTELRQLQNILKNPKQRGVLGEYWLETLLSNVLPNKQLYRMQYEIGSNEDTGQKLIADAVIFVEDQTIPIDAKFSLENYNRMMEEFDKGSRDKLEKIFKSDVKKRIDETSKYIRPESGTTNFAFMFIPAEGVYYNLLNAEIGSGVNSNNLVEYAFAKQVMLVSPTSFYAYLQTVLMGLRKLEIEQSTQDIIKRVGELGKHFGKYREVHEKIGKNLSTVVNQYNTSGNELTKISKDVIRITKGNNENIITIDSVEKPTSVLE